MYEFFGCFSHSLFALFHPGPERSLFGLLTLSSSIVAHCVVCNMFVYICHMQYSEFKLNIEPSSHLYRAYKESNPI